MGVVSPLKKDSSLYKARNPAVPITKWMDCDKEEVREECSDYGC